MVRADLPSNTQRGGVCIYYKKSIGARIIDIPNLIESILCQIAINNKTGYVVVVYRFPSQASDDFENVLSSFDQVITDMSLSNPVFRLILLNCPSILGGRAIFALKKAFIWNQSRLLMGFTNLSQIQHIFFPSLPLALT